MHLFFPISRVDEDKRIVEGVAFANEIVAGEGGICLRASAMEDATADYMKFGTIRSMHQPNAAGTATPNDPDIAKECGVTWDTVDGKRVATLRSYISDDNDWKKVKDGTYKGYSVGVAPKVMRGKNVESCTWYETSLVDRPKDPDALLTTFRVDGMPDEVEVEILDEIERAEWTKEKRDALPDEDFGWPEEKKYPIADQEDLDAAVKLVGRAPDDMQDEIKSNLKKIAKRKDLKLPDSWTEERTAKPTVTRAAFAEYVEAIAPSDLRDMALNYLWQSLTDIQYGYDAMGQETTPEAKEAAVRETCGQFTEFMVGAVASGKLPNIMDPDNDGDAQRAVAPVITRAMIEEVAPTFALSLIDLDTLERYQASEARVNSLEQTVSTLTNEVDESKTEIARVQGLEKAAVERIRELECMPVRRPPVRNAQAVERTFAVEANPEVEAIKKLQDRKDEIMRAENATPKEREGFAFELLTIQRQLTQLGA